ncbi:MAG: hypothetical protein ACI9UV_000328 [Algoriphagus sp.]
MIKVNSMRISYLKRKIREIQNDQNINWLNVKI